MNQKVIVDAIKAEDVQDLLQHIAWTETIRPELMKQREMYTKLLVEATLGRPIQVQTAGGVVDLTKEQLAGKIYGIDYIFNLFEKIMARGARAVDELRAQGIT